MGAYLSLTGREVGWTGRLFEAERLLPFFVFRMDAYWRLGTYSNKYGKSLVFRPSLWKAIPSLHRLLLYGTNPT